MGSAYRHRAGTGVWVNDMRGEGMVGQAWPYGGLDDAAVGGIVSCMEVMAGAGYNEFDVFGLLATYSWPTDIVSAVDGERRRRVKAVLDAAHELGLKVLCGLGVYSWGFDAIIEADPRVAGGKRHVMCASREESWEWMRRVVDFIVDEFAFDGLHLESSDQGRCSCPACAAWGDVEYHSRINARTARYIRSRRPEMVLMVNMCGYIKKPYRAARREEFSHLVELSKEIDYLIDPGHFGYYVRPEDRAELIGAMECDFGTQAGWWVYPPQNWDRLRWFLPCVFRQARHIREVYGQGGRAMAVNLGPTINPSVEATVACAGRMMADVTREPREALAEVLEGLYRPRTPRALRGLVSVFERAERAYFENWSPHPTPPAEAPGEIHLEPFKSDGPGPAIYLSEDPVNIRGTMMTPAGRAAYKRELEALLQELAAIEDEMGEREKVWQIGTCIRNVIRDIDGFNS